MATPSNSVPTLAALADEIRQAAKEAALHERASIEKAIEAGLRLIEAKEIAGHGQWLPFLKRTGIHERTARNYMTLARSGLKSATVADLGGVRAALSFLAEPRLPKSGEAILLEARDLIGLVFEAAEYPGFFHVHVTHDVETPDGEGRSYTTHTKRPVWPERFSLDGRSVSVLWQTVEKVCGGQRVKRSYVPRADVAGMIEFAEAAILRSVQKDRETWQWPVL